MAGDETIPQGAGAGSAAAAPASAAASAPAPLAPPAAPAAAAKGHSDDDVRAREGKAAERARAKLLEDLGIDDPEQAKALIKSAKDAEAKNLSELERERAAFQSSEKGRAKAEARAAELEKEATEAKTHLSLIKAGVKPDEVDVAAYLLTKERATLGKDFDEAKSLDELRKAKAYLFAGATQAATTPANTSAFGVPPPAAPTGHNNNLPVFDAMTLSAAEYQAFLAGGQHIPAGYRLNS